MAILLRITVKETKEELELLLKKLGDSAKPKLKMLLSILNGIESTSELVSITKANRDSIRLWKNQYRDHGLQALIKENRGGKRHGALNDSQKQELLERLSAPKGGFTSYKAAMEWINETFNIQMNYHAVNIYLKRNFGTKLKVGRKSHINKDENATALFKKLV